MDQAEAVKLLESIPATARVSVAQLQPNDVIVIHTDEPISSDTAARIKAVCEGVWPGRACVVLQHGLRLEIAPGEASA